MQAILSFLPREIFYSVKPLWCPSTASDSPVREASCIISKLWISIRHKSARGHIAYFQMYNTSYTIPIELRCSISWLRGTLTVFDSCGSSHSLRAYITFLDQYSCQSWSLEILSKWISIFQITKIKPKIITKEYIITSLNCLKKY